MNNPGDFNKRVVFLKKEDYSSNDFQKIRQEGKKLCEVWASCVPMASKESYEYNRLNNIVPLDLRTRYRKELCDETLLVIVDGKCYEINSVVDIGGKHRFLGFTCTLYKKAGYNLEYI